jgi:hypothetical protein
MKDESLLKRTLVLTTKLVGIFTIWIALVSVTVVAVTERMVLAFSSGTSDKGATVPAEPAKKGESSAPSGKNTKVLANKPNG